MHIELFQLQQITPPRSFGVKVEYLRTDCLLVILGGLSIPGACLAFGFVDNLDPPAVLTHSSIYVRERGRRATAGGVLVGV
jgi:hypothetical protein